MPNKEPKLQENKKGQHPFKRRLIALLIIICFIAVFLFAPFTAGLRSLAVAFVYDRVCEQQSLPQNLGFKVQMPLSHMDFSPLLLTFNHDAGMSAWLEKKVRFTVDYAAGSFDFMADHSRFYNVDSPLYNTYIGAYYLQGLGKAAYQDTVMKIASFDQRCLALPAIGLSCDQAVFEAANVKEYSKETKIAGLNWQRYDATITTNGPEHTRKSFHTGYILFGDPPFSAAEYPLCQMAGRIYTTYIKETDLTIGLYILAKDETILDEIDQKILLGMTISKK